MRSSTVVVLLAALCGCGRDARAPDAPVVARVDSLVAAFQRATYAPGVSVSVIRAGRDTLLYRGYGVADLENRVAATPETVYGIGSITKQFTAAAVMKLAEGRRISLDDPVGKHLPDLPAAWRGARIRQLLNHTAGLPEYGAALRDGMHLRDGVTPDSVVALVGRDPVEFAPGTRWEYSNTGYVVLGMLIERVAGERYEAYLRSTFFDPLGLKATRGCAPEPLIEQRAAGYLQRDTGVVNAPFNNMRVVFAAGALCSTVGDLAAWERALVTGRAISPASFRRMSTPEGAAVAENYGYGLIATTWEGHRIVGHGGEVGGFRSNTAYLPDDSLSVVVLTNLGSSSTGELLLDIARAALAASPPR